ncbi:Cell Wall Hydrolase [Devosia sp. YR412]|uniref:cell wall hydrolase n=1 Tax=Devosia sp. YR412 TaxID=1881030 RepID=UPI0008CA7E6A|nr:cell wall hydrolase [Devosia sp. YR412]SEP83375.1 Cell Wall Hydrolase [Devosia sp. YR412]
MASSHRPVALSRPARAVRRHPFTRLLVVGIFCSLSYAALTNGAFGPTGDLADTLPADVDLVTASLSYYGVDPVITGSVDHLFDSASFTGPNRAEKTDRVRPAVDLASFTQSFEETRTRIASLRNADAIALGQSLYAAVELPASGDVEIGPRMSVASLDPSTAAALEAIAGIAPSVATPLPAMASQQLAYARETAPVTGAFSSGVPVAANEKELWCLATAVYFEARGESYRGQVAVAQVVLNRVKDHRYPDTICGVVFQNQSRRNSCQFSFACDGIPEVINDSKSWAQAQDIAQRFTAGELYLTEVADATHYHATYVSPAWAPRMTKVTQIGLHVFYKFKRGWLFG